MKPVEKWGTDVETATELALQELGLTKDEVDVTILEEPSKGFLGIGAKLALVRVEKKDEKKAESKDKIVESKIVENKKTSKVENQETKKQDIEKNNLQEKKEEIENIINADVPKDLKPCENHEGLSFLREMIKNMGLDLNITAKEGENYLYLEINGNDSGVVIGKRGQTLDAIQYLVSLAVNKDREEYVRVIVDAENYRAKREETLMNLAERLADKAVKTNKKVKLEPMNPYERKVIHSTLQEHEYVTTKSEGEGSYRRVVIELK